MFKKDKGKVLQFANGLLLITILVIVVLIIQHLINTLLPAGGDYSQFNLNDFLCDLLILIWNLVVTSLALLLINKKLSLFDPHFVRSRKILNLIFFFTAVSMLTYWGNYIFSVIFNRYFDKEGIANFVSFGLSYGTGLIIANKYNVLIKKNTKGLNFLNFAFIIIAASAFGGMLKRIFDYFYYQQNIIDLIRFMLSSITVTIIFIVAVYFLNRNKLKDN